MFETVGEFAIMWGARAGFRKLHADFKEAFANYREALTILKERRDQGISTLQREQSIRAGLDAFIDQVKTNPGNCQALRATGRKFKNGSNVSYAQLAYDRAHDEMAAKFGMPHLIEARKAARA